MTQREIRDHKFKILFSYYNLQDNVDDVLINYFNNYPYDEETGENSYVGDISKSHKTIHKLTFDVSKKEINESDKAVEILIGDEENIRNIKQKVKDIVLKINEIDEMISSNLESWEISRVGKAELTIIRLAIYEMYYDVSIDIGVAINEAVELAKVYGDDKADKFVNGVLATIYKVKKI